MNKQTLELKTFLEELEHNSKIPDSNYIEIKYVIERITDILDEKIEIKDDNDYFFLLGQVSCFICSSAPKEDSKKRMVQETLMNTNYDINILSSINKHLRYVGGFIALDSESGKRFQNAFARVLNYKSNCDRPLSNDNYNFLRGFYSNTGF